MPLRQTPTNSWDHIQGFLFPMLRAEVGPLTAQHERLVIVLDLARIEAFVQIWPGLAGRPAKDRHALARAFVMPKACGARRGGRAPFLDHATITHAAAHNSRSITSSQVSPDLMSGSYPSASNARAIGSTRARSSLE